MLLGKTGHNSSMRGYNHHVHCCEPLATTITPSIVCIMYLEGESIGYILIAHGCAALAIGCATATAIAIGCACACPTAIDCACATAIGCACACAIIGCACATAIVGCPCACAIIGCACATTGIIDCCVCVITTFGSRLVGS